MCCVCCALCTQGTIGEGVAYQLTEFIKHHMPRDYFGLLVVDEGHEYKTEGSAQGKAMGVSASQCHKALLLTGTLMGSYADDLFHLLWRRNPAMMIEVDSKSAMPWKSSWSAK
jgi:SNF2 family DNA or RNA helicase